MSINDTLLKHYKSRDKKPGLLEITKIIEEKSLNRNVDSNNAIKTLLSNYGKETFSTALKKLAEIECNITDLAPKYRYHISHSLMVYILGTMVKDKFININKQYSQVTDLSWTVASLLHDIGYPVQIAHKYILEVFSSSISLPEINNNSGETTQLFRIVPYELEIMLNEENILYRFDEIFQAWGVGEISAVKQYKNMINSGKIQHGLISAILVINVIESLYNKNNHWNSHNFNSEIVYACAAIFLHNVYFDKSLQGVKLRHDKAPLAFLLILCDCMQEWDRFSKDNESNIPASLFDIEVNSSGVTLFVPNVLIKEKIYNECAQRLCMDCVEIRLMK